MSSMLNISGASLRAILCFIDPENTPKIANDRDDLALPLIAKIKEAVGDRDGSQSVFISFSDSKEDQELYEQFHGVCENIEYIFNTIVLYTKP